MLKVECFQQDFGLRGALSQDCIQHQSSMIVCSEFEAGESSVKVFLMDPESFLSRF